MYDFFLRHFGLSGNSSELPLAPLACGMLTVTSTGQIASDPAYSDARFLPDLVAAFAAENEKNLQVRRNCILFETPMYVLMMRWDESMVCRDREAYHEAKQLRTYDHAFVTANRLNGQTHLHSCLRLCSAPGL